MRVPRPGLLSTESVAPTVNRRVRSDGPGAGQRD